VFKPHVRVGNDLKTNGTGSINAGNIEHLAKKETMNAGNTMEYPNEDAPVPLHYNIFIDLEDEKKNKWGANINQHYRLL
jgi:hypothetical protein